MNTQYSKVSLSRKQRRLLAQEVAKSSESVTEESVDCIKAGLFQSPEIAIEPDFNLTPYGIVTECGI